MTVRILDGATHTTIRQVLVPHRRDFGRVEDNGQNIDLTEE
ncbi:hypothetical protein [Mycetocola miduiensis]|nr:hypothetical protein [Mycetocola miduiensis]